MDTHISIENKIFYHGTDANFREFDEKMKGSNTGRANTVHGFFFADSIENALLFGQRIITAKLDIKNLVDFHLHAIFNLESQASVIWEILNDEVLTNADAMDALSGLDFSLGEVGDLYDTLYSEEANAILKQRGYDGIISSLGNNQVEYVVFRAEQILYV